MVVVMGVVRRREQMFRVLACTHLSAKPYASSRPCCPLHSACNQYKIECCWIYVQAELPSIAPEEHEAADGISELLHREDWTWPSETNKSEKQLD
jgi:hypothetical protein